MYSRLIKILKFSQFLGYIGALIVAGFYAVGFLMIGINYKFSFLFSAILLCFANYLVSQTLIAVVDLLNRIESNTRNLK